MDPTESAPTERVDREPSWMLAAAVGIGLLAFFLARSIWGDFRYPLGPDAPVYVWWARLAGAEGLSAVDRPGISALTLTLAGTLGVTPTQVLTGLGAMLGASTGMAAAAFTRGADRWPRAAFILGGAFAGTFAVHLTGGYFANVAFAALFIAAAALLAERGWVPAIGAGALLAAAGLAHPLFLPLGAVILLLALPWRDLRSDEAKQIAGAALGGAAIAGLGLVTLLFGPRPPQVPTSKDGYLRAAGMESLLRDAYLERLARHWPRYAWPVSLPLAMWGAWRGRGFHGRLLRGWLLLTAGGVAIALVTFRFPAERMLTFAYALPIAAALGLLQTYRWLAARSRRLAVAATGVAAIVMLAGAAYTWAQHRPFVDDAIAAEARAVADTARTAPPATPIVIGVDTPGDAVAFDGAMLGNIQRAAMDEARIRDVYVLLGNTLETERTPSGDAAHDRLVTYAIEQRPTGAAWWIIPRESQPPTSPDLFGDEWRHVAREGSSAPPDGSPWAPTSPWVIALLAGAMLGVVTLAGYGWSRAVVGVGGAAVRTALAPTFGIAALIATGFVADRLGFRLTGATPILVVALAGGAGYALAALRQGLRVPGSAPEVQ